MKSTVGSRNKASIEPLVYLDFAGRPFVSTQWLVPETNDKEKNDNLNCVDTFDIPYFGQVHSLVAFSKSK